MFVHTHTRRNDFRSTSGTVLAQSPNVVNVEADTELSKRIDLEHGATDIPVDVQLTAASLKSVYMLADGPVTIKTNSSGTPVDEITLVPGLAYSWAEGDTYMANWITQDVTQMFLTENNDADPAQTTNVSMEFLYDATP